MRIYYFENALSDEDMIFVAKQFGVNSQYEQIRIPHVLPSNIAELNGKVFERHEALLCAALRNAGIARDYGKQIAMVAPRDLYWYAVLATAVNSETGAFPWLVQTKKHRDEIGNPGETRILDMNGLMRGN